MPFAITNIVYYAIQFIGRKPDPSDERHGLVFRAFLYLFQLLQERKDTNFIMKASFLEIYNEKVCKNKINLIIFYTWFSLRIGHKLYNLKPF